MAILLAFDIGTKRTGVALADDRKGFVVALDTLHHEDDAELIHQISALVKNRGAAGIIIGLPVLPQGGEGSRSAAVRRIVKQLESSLAVPITLLDERYTSVASPRGADPDASAACALLTVAIDRKRQPE